MNEDTRVLIIDDDPDYAELVCRYISSKVTRNNITKTFSLKEAIEKDKQFDVILADMVLYDANGVDIINQLKFKWPTTPIVAMSGKMDESDVHAIMEAGAQDLLLKDEVTTSNKYLARILSRAIDRSEILAGTMKAHIEGLRKTIEKLNSL